jgi:diguanylate cyclase (GGDEF)-like protein
VAAALDPWSTNRILFQSHVERAIGRARGSRRQLALLYIDLDRIGQVNHAMGREFGDQVLAQAAARLEQALAAHSGVVRIAPDDFAGLVEAEGLESAAQLAARLLERCREPYVVDCLALKVTASIGFSLLPSHADDAAALLQRAERALYRAKIAGRDCYYPGGTTCSAGIALPPRKERG